MKKNELIINSLRNPLKMYSKILFLKGGLYILVVYYKLHISQDHQDKSFPFQTGQEYHIS